MIVARIGVDGRQSQGKFVYPKRRVLSEFFEEYRFEFEPWQSEEIQLSGDWAFHRFSGIATLMPKGGGEPTYLDRKYIDILRKIDGSRKISHHIYNTNE